MLEVEASSYGNGTCQKLLALEKENNWPVVLSMLFERNGRRIGGAIFNLWGGGPSW